MMGTDKAAVFFTGQEIIEINRQDIEELKERAARMPLRRARLCLHHSHDDKVQEMVIAFCKDSYVRPHRHLKKTESFHIIEGELLVVFFNEEGEIARRIKMGPYGSGSTFIYRLSSSLWHAVMPLSESVVIHESTTGPFIKEEAEFPSWAPEENDTTGIRRFLTRVISCSTGKYREGV